jgi:tRNA pseudouridine32 synthase/23S rRNA pseudouridine746 synthase
MASIDCPIVGDPFYPTIQEKPHASVPLQLLVRRLGFVDPLTKDPRQFGSTRRLQRAFVP